MPSRTNPSRWLPAALALASAVAMPGAARAVSPTANDFQITYRFTDDEGNVVPSQRLVGNDLSYYVNRARCQCGERFSARVFLQPSQAGPYDQNPIRAFVGSQCDSGQNGNSLQNLPCALVAEGQPTDFDDGGREIGFDVVWLSSRVPNLQNQSVETAEPIDPCGPSQTGDAGVWICVEDLMQTGCQSSEFIITGTQNENGSATGTGTGTTDPTQPGSTGGIRFDYLPPQGTVTGFQASPGDGAVKITWDPTESTDINGFRVLCADLDGNPPPRAGASEPTGARRTQGELYFTAENLCPGEVVWESSDAEVPTPTFPTDTDGGTDGRDTDGSGTTSAGAAPWLGDGWSMATTGTGGTGTGGTGTGTDGTGTDGRGTDTSTGTDGSGTDAGSGTDGTTGGTIDSPLASLDWRYVCSDHISRTGTEAKVLGLENGKEYQFLVVAYDRAGNPLIVSDVLTETPAETSDFWEQCEQQGDLCGDGGFCQCRSGASPSGAAWLATGLLLLGLRRRRIHA